MLEFLLCASLTILPDYLLRRYLQGKRLGHEITLYSVWYELRWGIVTCLMLTILMITAIFYFHPSSTSVTIFFRTIPIVPEASGRVAEVHITGRSANVKQGELIFKLDSSRQEAAIETAKSKIAQIDADMVAARVDLQRADGQLTEARGGLQQAIDELQTKRELVKRSPNTVSARDIQKLEVSVATAEGTVQAATAARASVETKISALLPAARASAEASLAEAQVEFDRTFVRAGVAGRIEQFGLKVGDVVNPMMRAAGVLIPEKSGREVVQASFDQLEAQVIKVGMLTEVTCISKPWTIVPMVVVEVQDYIAAGQFGTGAQLLEGTNVTRPGTILAFLEPLYANGLEGITPGSSCAANAYTSNHDKLATAGFFEGLALHAVDAVGVVHAAILRSQALLLPIQNLVLGGH